MLRNDKTYTFSDGATFRIVCDEDPLNPRKEYDHAGIMVCFHGRYTLGDEGHGFREDGQSSWRQLEESIRKKHGGLLAILPLYLMDHSGITINTTGFQASDPQRWDWGQIGFIFTTRGRMQKMGWKKKDRTEEKALETLRSEVEDYDTYLRGYVWCYLLDNTPDGEDDSLSGIIGPDLAHVLEFLPEKYHEEIRAFDPEKKAA